MEERAKPGRIQSIRTERDGENTEDPSLTSWLRTIWTNFAASSHQQKQAKTKIKKNKKKKISGDSKFAMRMQQKLSKEEREEGGIKSKHTSFRFPLHQHRFETMTTLKEWAHPLAFWQWFTGYWRTVNFGLTRTQLAGRIFSSWNKICMMIRLVRKTTIYIHLFRHQRFFSSCLEFNNKGSGEEMEKTQHRDSFNPSILQKHTHSRKEQLSGMSTKKHKERKRLASWQHGRSKRWIQSHIPNYERLIEMEDVKNIKKMRRWKMRTNDSGRMRCILF